MPYQSADPALLTAADLRREDLAAAVHVVDGPGVYRGAAAVNHLLRGRQPYASFILVAERVPFVLALEERAYAFVARHRTAISRLFGLTACRRS